MVKSEGPERASDTLAKWLGIIVGIPAVAAIALQLFLVATGQQTLVDYLTGKQAVVVAAHCTAPAEKTAWDSASAEKTRTALGAYLAAYSDCPNATRARDLLATCRSEVRKVWQRMSQAEKAPGVGAIGAGTEEAACAEAVRYANESAKSLCETVVNTAPSRNVSNTLGTPGACTCKWGSCTTEVPFRCSWEGQYDAQVDVCG